jgi:hypothetical protein
MPVYYTYKSTVKNRTRQPLHCMTPGMLIIIYIEGKYRQSFKFIYILKKKHVYGGKYLSITEQEAFKDWTQTLLSLAHVINFK